ncbi:uncharacterized protein LOC113321866 [Papaver somniferum]|nr:uncharacterized protein LOC113321866 [Papaver somniferum]
MVNIRIRNHQLTENDGSVILIFARGGRAVTREEIRDYFRSNYGADCVKSIRLHYREPCRTLFSARVVFYSMSTVESVLHGQGYVLLVINGTLVSVRANARRSQPIDVVAAGSPPPAPATPAMILREAELWSEWFINMPSA